MKILITPRSFGKYEDEPREKLRKAGFEIIENETGGILTKEQMIEQCKDVDAIIVGVDPLDKDVLESANCLKVISKYGVGVDNIDVDYAASKGIEVTITRGANSAAVADYAFALLLGCARRLVEIDQGCREGDWSKKVSLDVYGKKIGILGLGAIGRGVAERAHGFGMEIYGYDVYRDDAYLEKNQIHFSDIDTICRECDFISLHLPYTAETHHLIGVDRLQMMKKTAILVNTARGGLVDEAALFEALTNGEISGAGLDVFEHEPAKDSPLLKLDHVIAGSHCSASSRGAVSAMSMMAVDNVLSILNGKE